MAAGEWHTLAEGRVTFCGDAFSSCMIAGGLQCCLLSRRLHTENKTVGFLGVLLGILLTWKISQWTSVVLTVSFPRMTKISLDHNWLNLIMSNTNVFLTYNCGMLLSGQCCLCMQGASAMWVSNWAGQTHSNKSSCLLCSQCCSRDVVCIMWRGVLCHLPIIFCWTLNRIVGKSVYLMWRKDQSNDSKRQRDKRKDSTTGGGK